MSTTATKTNSNGTVNATQAMNDAFKAGCEANQKVMNTFTNNFSKGFNPFAVPAMPTMDMPAMFEKMTKAMNAMVDSTARMTTECGTICVDTMRNNARIVERTGDMMVSQFSGKTPATKPVAETCREIFDEAVGFTTKTNERIVKMNTEHAQRVAGVVEETMTCCGGKSCNA